MGRRDDYFMDSEEDVKRTSGNHEIIKHAMGGRLIIAPIDLTRPNLRVLDAGTSDGFWIRDFLKDNPAVDYVFGTDIDDSRFPPTQPEGVKLVKHDNLEPWPAEWKNSFDLVHQRFVLMGSKGNPQLVINRLCELVKPGGWIQLIEASESVGEEDGPAMKQYLKLMQAMGEGLHNEFSLIQNLGEDISNAGFIRVGEMTIPYSIGPANPEPKLREASIDQMQQVIGGVIGYVRLQPNNAGFVDEELDTLPSRLDAELRERGGYYPLRAAWGQKPQRR